MLGPAGALAGIEHPVGVDFASSNRARNAARVGAVWAAASGMRIRTNRRWVQARYFGVFHQSRRDQWVFGDRDTGRYLVKFAWTPIVRHRGPRRRLRTTRR